MANETVDKSGTKQLSISFRWVDNNFKTHEEFVRTVQ